MKLKLKKQQQQNIKIAQQSISFLISAKKIKHDIEGLKPFQKCEWFFNSIFTL
jgi:hypothetical protein